MPIACSASLGADPVEAASASGCSPQSCGSAGRRGNPSPPCPCYFVELHYPWLEGFGNGVVRTADPRPLQIGNNHYERLAPPSSRACIFCIVPWWVWQLTRPPHRDRGPLASPQLMRGIEEHLNSPPKFSQLHLQLFPLPRLESSSSTSIAKPVATSPPR